MNIRISRRTFGALAVALPVVRANAQSIFPIDPEGGYSFRYAASGDSMFTNAGLNSAIFGNTSFVGVQVIPQESELQAVLDSGRSHFDLVIEISGLRRIENPSVIGDTESGAPGLNPYARMATSELSWQDGRLTHTTRCLNIRTDEVWRWQPGELLNLTATLSGYARASDAWPTVSVGLVPCIYELVEADEPHVLSVTTNGIELFYNRYAEGEPAFLVDTDGNYKFPVVPV